MAAFLFAGDFEEGFWIEAVDADVEFVQTGGAVLGEQFAEPESVGGKGDVLDFGLRSAGGNDVGQVAAQGGFAARDADFARAVFCEYGRQRFDFGQGELVRLGFALIAVGQAIVAAVVAQVGDGQAQVAQTAVEWVG